MSSPSYTDIGSLTEYFQRVRLPDGAADDYVMEYLHYALDRGEMVLSQLSPPYCLYLKAAPPVPGRRRSLNPCPLVVIRNAAGPGDPARIRLLVRKPAPAKPVEAERVPLHQWPEDEDGSSPTPTPTPPPSLKDRASAQLVEKLKRDQARNRVKSVPRYKAIFVRAFTGLSGRAFDDIWRDAKTAPGVKEIAKGRRPGKN
jgi:hypothetical protein